MAKDAMNQDFARGVSGSTGNFNNLPNLFGTTAFGPGPGGATGMSGAGVSGAYFDTFNFKLTTKSYETLGAHAAAVEAGLTLGITLVDIDGTAQEFRPTDITELYKDVSTYFTEKNSSQQETESNINSITDIKDLADAGGKGGSKVVPKTGLSSSISYKAVQSEKSKGTSNTSVWSNVYTGK